MSDGFIYSVLIMSPRKDNGDVVTGHIDWLETRDDVGDTIQWHLEITDPNTHERLRVVRSDLIADMWQEARHD